MSNPHAVHAVRPTSRDCYRARDWSREIDLVYQAIRHLGDACIAEIADYLGMQKSTVSARLNDLRQQEPCRIEFAGKRKSRSTGILSECWRVKRQQTLFDC